MPTRRSEVHGTALQGPWIVGVGLALWLSGCSTLPAPRSSPEPDVPTAWSAGGARSAADATVLTTWWQRFDDPLLADLVGRALQSNTSVAGARAALRQARALRDVAQAGLGPQVDGSGSASRNQFVANSGSNNFRAGLDAGWEVDLFGANRNAFDAGTASALASAAQLGDVQVSIAAEVALDYLALRAAQARLAIAQANLDSQLETWQLTRWRVQAGLLTSLEEQQARAAAEQTRALLPALRTSIEQSRHAIAVLTGQPPASLADELAEARPVPQPVGELALGIPAETLRQRPDVRAAELQVSAAAARVAQADAQRLPNFRLGGSLGLSALTLGSLTSGASLVGTLLGSVSVPVFDGGAGSARVRAQEAAWVQARTTYRATVLKALKDVEDALVALHNDRERLSSLRAAADAAGNAALLARQRYASGLVDFQTVLGTQRNQLSAEDSLAATRADLSADHVRLYKALGGGWQPEPASAAAPAAAATSASALALALASAAWSDHEPGRARQSELAESRHGQVAPSTTERADAAAPPAMRPPIR